MAHDLRPVFETIALTQGFFTGPNQVCCAAPFDNGQRIVYGTCNGIFLARVHEQSHEPTKAAKLRGVSQIDVLEDGQLLIALSHGHLTTIPLDTLDPSDPKSASKYAKCIASNVSFFKIGVCLGKTLLCTVKCSALSSVVKVMELADQNARTTSRLSPREEKSDDFRLFREFYIPTQANSVHFMKTKLCLGCPNGFQVVDLGNLDIQALVDPADPSLEFVCKGKPLALFRIKDNFLLCYDKFAFYVSRTGWQSRKDFLVRWESSSTSFALHYPYLLAFEPKFVEIRHVETGGMSQVIRGDNLSCLFADNPPSIANGRGSNQPDNTSEPDCPLVDPPSRLPPTRSNDILMVSGDKVMRVQLNFP